MARRYGIRVGLPLIEAQGIFPPDNCPNPVWEPDDLAVDADGLRQLVPLCQNFSPLVGINHEGLILDTGGCDHLFGGEHNLISQLADKLQAMGLNARLAIAGTLGCAWAISRFSPKPQTIISQGEDSACLLPLSIAALRLTEAVMARFHRLGIKTIEQFLRLPRTALPSRFGQEVLIRWDQARGEIPESFMPERLTEKIFASWGDDEGLYSFPALELVWRHLLESVLPQFAEKRIGLQEFTCEYRGNFSPTSWEVRLLNPAIDTKHVLGLLRLKFEKTPLQYPITSVRVEAHRLMRLPEHPRTLFDTDPDASCFKEFNSLVEQLSQRLGSEVVLQAQLQPDPQPEFAYTLLPWDTAEHTTSFAFSTKLSYRPLRQLHTPEPIHMVSVVPNGPPVRLWLKDKALECLQCWGPERIETGWWREQDVKRDYYRVETDTKQCLWVFRDRTSGRWFLHGIFE